MPGPVDLLVLCELNPDVIVRLGHGDEPGGTAQIRFGQVEQLVDGAELTLGGSGAITASAAAALGVPTAVCGVIGADRTGAAVRDLLDGFGVDTAYVRVDPELATGMTVVLARPDGDRAMLTFPGAIAALRTADVPAAAIASARHIHVSSIHLQTALVDGLVNLLASRPDGVTASLDPGWDPSEEWSVVRALLPQVDYLLPNEAECLAIAATVGPAHEPGDASGHPNRDLDGERDGGLTRADPVGDDDIVAAAAARLAAFGPTVVVKCGARGAVSVAPDGVMIRVEGEARAPVDTTGAGDNFDAGYLAAVIAGADPAAALARAVACGAISVGGIGGTGAMAGTAEALALAGRLPVHTMPSNTMPSNTMPSNTMPSNTMPSNTMPSNTSPGSKPPSTPPSAPPVSTRPQSSSPPTDGPKVAALEETA